MSYPLWTPITAVASTVCSAGLISGFMAQLSLAQQDFRRLLAGGYSSLASFIHVKQSPGDGAILSVYHISMIGVTANQHHAKVHATKHLTGASDAIQLSATNARRGFESTTQYKKINTFEASSTRNIFRASSFIGNGTSQLLNIGYCPKKLELIPTGSTSPVFEYIRYSIKAIKHNVAITTAHTRVNSSTLFVSDASGIKVKGSANTVSVLYFYWAMSDFKNS